MESNVKYVVKGEEEPGVVVEVWLKEVSGGEIRLEARNNLGEIKTLAILNPAGGKLMRCINAQMRGIDTDSNGRIRLEEEE